MGWQNYGIRKISYVVAIGFYANPRKREKEREREREREKDIKRKREQRRKSTSAFVRSVIFLSIAC